MTILVGSDRLAHEFPDIVRGDEYPIQFEFVDDAGQPSPVDGMTLFVTLKRSPMEPDSAAIFQQGFMLSGVGAQAGEIDEMLTPRQTLQLPAERLWMSYRLIRGENSAVTPLAGKVRVRAVSTWVVGADETVPVLYIPASVSVSYFEYEDGVTHDDAVLAAIFDSFVAIDNVDGQVAVTVDLSGLNDPITAGTYSVPVSATDAAGNTVTGAFNLVVTEVPAEISIEVLQTWTNTAFEVTA